MTVPNAADTAANRDKVREQVTEEKRNAYFGVYLEQLRVRMTKDGKMTTDKMKGDKMATDKMATDKMATDKMEKK